ncbi:MAG: discoidin domain-containing protein [Pyrinomonadaceae bacterium]
MQLQIPLGDYQGRGGMAFPITLNYSSKLWRIKHHDTTILGANEHNGESGSGYDSRFEARYAEQSDAGWTSSLDWFRWPDPNPLGPEKYSINGKLVSGTTYNRTVARRYVTLLDGSRHELRRDDTVLPAGSNTTSGVFYSVDGSRLRFDSANDTLYIPDGSRIVGASDGTSQYVHYIDRNGNRNTYSYATGQWTDTMGRAFSLPLPPKSNVASQPPPSDQTYTLPGVGNSTMSYTFKWRNLSDTLQPDGNNQTPPLRYTCDRSLVYPHTDIGPSLFTSFGELENSVVCLNQALFNPVVLSQVVLPNGTAYTFKYNVWGEISRIDYPTGGYEKFTYSAVESLSGMTDDGLYSQANRGVVSRVVSAPETQAGVSVWMYETSLETSTTPYRLKGKITAPDGSYTETLYHSSRNSDIKYGFDDAKAGKPFDERAYSPSGQMLRRTLTEWETTGPTPTDSLNSTATRNARPVKTVEMLLDTGGSDALASTTTYQYDTDVNLISTSKYEFFNVPQATAQSTAIGSITMPVGTSLLRTDEIDYLTNNQTYRDSNLLSLPIASRVRDGNNNIVAQSQMFYDETPLTSYGGVTNWSDPGTSARGNLTRTSRWVNTSGTWVEARVEYDQCGNALKSIDARGKQSEVEYAAAYAYAYPTHTISAVPDPTGAYGSNTALETWTAYDFSTGLVTSTTDANNQVTSFQYNDPLNRLTLVTRPGDTQSGGGGHTTYDYGDTPGNLFVRTLTTIDATHSMDAYQYYDGLGRSYRTTAYENQDAAKPWVTTDTAFDALGRAKRATHPYRSVGGATSLFADANWQANNPNLKWTESAYDALGRLLTVTTKPDSAVVTTSYTGNYVTVTDQAGKVRRSQTDALGRLVRVDEPDSTGNLGTTSAPIQPSTYIYDVLGNLRQVAQGAQSRYFMYDSLSRLIRAKNPEQGNLSVDSDFPAKTDATSGISNSAWSIGYAYDDNGNLVKRKDARNVTTTYAYDNLNRNTTVTYTGESAPDITPNVAHFYDNAAANSYGLGRLWKSVAGASQTVINNYDLAGRPLSQSQQLVAGGAFYTLSRQYDLMGHVTSQTYPSGRTVTYQYDAAGRLSDFSGNLGDWTGRAYSSGVSYDGAGGMNQERFGTDTPVYNKRLYNSRGQLAEIRVGTTSNDTGWNRGAIINHYSDSGWGASGGGADNNGNLHRQDIYIPNSDAPGYDQPGNNHLETQSFAYDSLNRLTSVSTSGGPNAWSQGYTYDRFSNRTINQATTTDTAGINKKPFAVDTSSNRLGVPAGAQGVMNYDAAGNLVVDTYSNDGGGGTRTYDAENRMTGAQFLNGQTQNAVYTYDADGRRVKRNIGGQETWQVYGMDGELLAEYAATAQASSPQKEYGYRNGELLIIATGSASLDSNLALGTSSAQSSTYPAGGIDAAKALDGDPNTITHSQLQAQPWWQTDLGGSRQISTIKLWNRADCCQDRLSNFYIFISDSPFTSTNAATTAAQPGVWNAYVSGQAPMTLERAVGRTGRYVRIQLTGTNYLSLAEVQVLGPPAAPPVSGSGFETPALSAGAFQLAPSNGAWTYAGGAGVSSNGSGYTYTNASAPQGTQVAFIQGAGSSVSQAVAGFEGSVGYKIAFKAAQRANVSNGGQDFDVYLDSMLLGTYCPASGGAYETIRTAAFTTTQGAHTVKFVGRNTSGGDNTAFIDDVKIEAAEAGEAKVIPYAATASGTYQSAGPEKAVDGDPQTYWNSGGFPAQWIQLDLGQTYKLTRVRLRSGGSPDGHTTHQIYGGPSASQMTLLGTLDGNTVSGQWLELPTGASHVRYLKVNTTADPSWVSWYEVEVYSETGPQLLTPASTTASSSYETAGPQYATDGNVNTAWVSGGFAPAWIQLDLGRSYSLTRVRLNIGQSPDGHTVHEVYGGATAGGQMSLLGTIDGNTVNGQWLELLTNGQAVRYLKVVTTQDPSWVSWNEIEAYGSPAAGSESDVEWLVSDQLGTPRMVIDKTGSLSGVKRHDYLPFGEEIGAGVGGRTTQQGYSQQDGNRKKWAKLERDDETGLDYSKARYYSSGQGRFISPDPYGPWAMSEDKKIGFLSEPQHWNRYTYVTNNPQKFTDPDGLERYAANVSEERRKQIRTALEEIAKNGDKKQKIVANFILKSDVLIYLFQGGDDGLTNVTSRDAANSAISSGFINVRGAGQFVQIGINSYDLGATPDRAAALEGVLVHEGDHAFGLASTISELSSRQGAFYNPTTYQDEYSAFKSEANYYVRRGHDNPIYNEVGLGGRDGSQWTVVLQESNGTFKFNEAKVNETLRNGYGVTKENPGPTTADRSKLLQPLRER